MNRQQRRASEKNGRVLQRQPWDTFRDVTFEAIARHREFYPESNFRPDQVFQNNKYVVQIFLNKKRKGKTYTRIMVRRSDGAPIYSWNDLFRIKNEIFGDEIEAVQFMPPKSELTDVANLYWFWIEN